MGKLILGFALALGFSGVAYAGMGFQGDDLQICYLMKSGKITKTVPCISSLSYVSGGVMRTYHFEPYTFNVLEMEDVDTVMNDVVSDTYFRSAKSFNKIKDINKFNGDTVYCYAERKPKGVELCVK